jgi:alanine racemase
MRSLAQLEILEKRLLDNLYKIQQRAGARKLLPMVKANAYGHGVDQIVPILVHKGQCRDLGVATWREALQVLEISPELESVTIFSELNLPEMVEDTTAPFFKKLIPVLSHRDQLQFFLGHQKFKQTPVCLKFNSGMNRLGFETQELTEVISLLKNAGRTNIFHVMSHLATSSQEIKIGDRNHRQRGDFAEQLKLLKASGLTLEHVSLGNSGAIEQSWLAEETIVRPGLMLYGPQSVRDKKFQKTWDGQCVSRLSAEVIQVRELKKGTPVGYGNHVLSDDGKIVFIPLGYGDGIPTQAQGFILPDGGKIFGRVNMDMMAIFYPQHVRAPQKGDRVTVWSENEHVLSLADYLQTHAYQIFCQISGRVPKRNLKT